MGVGKWECFEIVNLIEIYVGFWYLDKGMI